MTYKPTTRGEPTMALAAAICSCRCCSITSVCCCWVAALWWVIKCHGMPTLKWRSEKSFVAPWGGLNSGGGLLGRGLWAGGGFESLSCRAVACGVAFGVVCGVVRLVSEVSIGAGVDCCCCCCSCCWLSSSSRLIRALCSVQKIHTYKSWAAVRGIYIKLYTDHTYIHCQLAI